MKVIRIDTMPLNNDLIYSNDYCGKVVYSAISDPLFRYERKTKSIKKYACDKYRYNAEENFWEFTIRDDLFYYNGERVYSEDYKMCLDRIIEHKNCYSYFLLKNIKKVEVMDKYTFKIYLKTVDELFYKRLSIYNITPIRDGISSGPYYILKNGKRHIELIRNPWYRFKLSNSNNLKIKFSVSKNFRNDVKLFENKKIDITNNTMFPYEIYDKYKNKVIKEKNFIFVSLDFSTELMKKEYTDMRKDINNAINRENINAKLKNCAIPINSFLLDEFKSTKNAYVTPRVKRCSLKLGYDDFYPNLIIAKNIKAQLKKIGIDIELIKNKYGSINDNELNLVLHFIPYISNDAFYTSFLFYYFGNNDYKSEYNAYLISKNLIHLQNMVKNKKLESYMIPILQMNSIYLINSDMEKFNFQEMNYEEL